MGKKYNNIYPWTEIINKGASKNNLIKFYPILWFLLSSDWLNWPGFAILMTFPTGKMTFLVILMTMLVIMMTMTMTP